MAPPPSRSAVRHTNHCATAPFPKRMVWTHLILCAVYRNTVLSPDVTIVAAQQYSSRGRTNVTKSLIWLFLSREDNTRDSIADSLEAFRELLSVFPIVKISGALDSKVSAFSHWSHGFSVYTVCILALTKAVMETSRFFNAERSMVSDWPVIDSRQITLHMHLISIISDLHYCFKIICEQQYITCHHFLRQVVHKNGRGPSTEPWRTPDVTGFGAETAPL